MKRLRCPNKSRKDKFGNCIKTMVGMNPQTKKRCPNGSRKNKLNVCVSTNKTRIKRISSSERNTPRTIYAKKYFVNTKDNIHLFADPTKDVVLFQVNYNVKQLLNYQNLITTDTYQPIDCLFQSLFSLGLRNVKMSKNDSMNINLSGKFGVTTIETAKYIHTAFGLSPHEVVEYNAVKLNKNDNISTPKIINKKITKFFNTYLENGYATIIFIKYKPLSSDLSLAHAIVVYKYENNILFFDPQSKNIRSDSKVYTMFVSDIIDTTINNITHYFYCRIWNLKTPKPLTDDSCLIAYEK